MNAEEESREMLEEALAEEMERRYVSLRQERDQLQSTVQSVREELAIVNEKYEKLQTKERTLAETQHQLEMTRDRLAALETEKRNMVERMDRGQAEADALRDEIRYVHPKIHTLSLRRSWRFLPIKALISC